MNIQKIIPLTLATLSVMGAFTACSDDKIVGVDEQANTMAERSSSSMEPGSSNSDYTVYIPEEFLAEIRSVNIGTAVTLGRLAGEEGLFKDTVNAHQTFDDIIQSIINNDVIRTAESVFFNECFTRNDCDEETIRRYIEYFEEREKEYQTMILMKNEEGLVYGPIYFDGYEGDHQVYCEKQMKDLERKGGGSPKENYLVYLMTDEGLRYVEKRLLVSDTTVREQFKQECALEHGVYEEILTGFAGSESSYQNDSLVDYVNVPLTRFPEFFCHQIPLTSTDESATYKDPSWKKYATHIIESCATTQKFDELFGLGD